MEGAARVEEIKHLHRKRTQKCLFSKIRPNSQKDGQEILQLKNILWNRPKNLAVNQKKEELLEWYYEGENIFLDQ